MSEVTSVDISALYQAPSPARDACDIAIWSGLRATGSVVVTGYPDADLVDTRARTGLAFFDVPEADKRRVTSKLHAPENAHTYRGYHPHDPASDFRTDFLDIGPDDPQPGPDLAGMHIVTEKTPWPKPEPAAGWYDAVRAYYDQMEDLAKRLMHSIGRSAGFAEAEIEARFGGQHSTLRFLDYPASTQPAPKDGPAISAVCHTDASGLSLLWQAGPGLQAQGPDGVFYDIPMRPDCVSVHVGTVMTTMTGGAVPATPHRVLDHGVRRQSVGFFLEPALSAPITAADAVGRAPAPEETYGWQVLTQLASYGDYGDEIVAPGRG
ncbi:MAG: 2OG-Fe(II) oxygenase family protein [Pseudomonadota bacterium]